MNDANLPGELSINAWTGSGPVTSAIAPGATEGWSTIRAFGRYSVLLEATEIDRRDWRHPDVGWGVVLSDNEDLPEADRATAVDAPDAIRALVASRPNAVVLRYRPEVADHDSIRRYDANGHAEDLAITGGRRGTGAHCIPRYLLIYGGPEVIPWAFQYRLGLDFQVGRLDLEGVPLERYVDALMSEWSSAACRRSSPVIWSTDHAPSDITHLMRLAIADPLRAKFAADDETSAGLHALLAAEATANNLLARLDEARPALVVTTSHGMTGPLSNPNEMQAQLGWLVDADHAPIDPDAILGAWEPDGAIWYAHACCSAGGDGGTAFRDLVPRGSDVDQVLQGIAGLDPAVASCPRALLGASKPLRAFIGQVEPTFDWTLQAPTRERLTGPLLEALYQRMYLRDPDPVGLAFDECARAVGSLRAKWDREVDRAAATRDPEERRAFRQMATRTKLAALDRQTTVILGDPTATMPSLERN